MRRQRRTDHFVTQEILAGGNARRDLESDFALVRNHAVDAPRLVVDVQSVLVDLEPIEVRHVCLGRVGNLGTKK